MNSIEKEYENMNFSISTLLKTIDAKDCKDSNRGLSQNTFSIGRGGSGNVAMSRDNYTKNEIATHNEFLKLAHG